jgi:O-antigen/teichoic acid export membrane protein
MSGRGGAGRRRASAGGGGLRGGGLRGGLRGGVLRGAIVRGAAGSAAVKAGQALAALVVTVVLARALGPAGFGLYAFAQAVVMLLVLPASFGLPQLVLRETARAQAAGDWGRLRGLWRWAGLRVLGLSLAAAALLLAGGGLAAAAGDPRGPALMIGAALLPLIGLGNLRGEALQGLRHVVLGQLPERLLRPAGLAGLAAVAFFPAGLAASPAAAMALHAAAAALAFAAGAWWLHRKRPAALAGPGRPAPVYDGPAWWAAAWPLGLSAGLLLVVQQADLIMLGLMRAEEEVAAYRAASQAGLLVVFGAQAVTAAVNPYMARRHAEGDRAGLQRLVRLAAAAMTLAALPLVALYAAAGDWLLAAAFGPAFAAGYAALVILAAGRLIHAAFGPAGMLLNMTGHERATLRGSATAAIANLVLNALLIPPFGMAGAAAATTATLTLWNAMLYHAARRRLGIDSACLRLLPGPPAPASASGAAAGAAAGRASGEGSARLSGDSRGTGPAEG